MMQHPLLSQTKAILDQYLQANQHILLGVSGGPDSMTLLSSIQNYYSENKYDPDHIHVLYCDHQTRPEIAQEIELVRTYTPHNRFTSVTYD